MKETDTVGEPAYMPYLGKYAEAYLNALAGADVTARALGWFGLGDKAVNAIGLQAVLELAAKTITGGDGSNNAQGE